MTKVPTKVPSKTKTAVPADKPKRTKTPFKPDIRLANAIVGAIAFLQKAGFQATPKIIKKCIHERSKKSISKGIEQLPLYLNRGLELGILKKWHGSFKLGDFQIKKRNPKRRKVAKTVEVIKEAGDMKKDLRQSAAGSVCAF